MLQNAPMYSYIEPGQQALDRAARRDEIRLLEAAALRRRQRAPVDLAPTPSGSSAPAAPKRGAR
jgi:hypothetical protein